jgi:hypothetical protein
MSRIMKNENDKDQKHTLHTYKRSDTNEEIYKCLHPYCTHYINRDFLENKASLCPKCGEEMILTRQALKKRIPVCLQCGRSPRKKLEKTAEQVIDEILSEVNLTSEEDMEEED